MAEFGNQLHNVGGGRLVSTRPNEEEVDRKLRLGTDRGYVLVSRLSSSLKESGVIVIGAGIREG